MKIRIVKKIKSIGNALLIALVLCGILCVSVTGYLSVTEQQNFLNARSQSWNMAIVVTEAGIEEGLEHLNMNGSTNIGADGWTFDGTWYSHTNGNFPDGDWYKVSINASNPSNPVLICSSTVFAQTWVASKQSPFFFAASGVPQTIASNTVKRAVQVTCSRSSLFSAPLVVKTVIDLNGNGVLTDSFDSTNPGKSTNGKYDSSKYTGDLGDVATNGGITNSGSVNVGNASIYGHCHTGPNCPFKILPNGTVGSHAWVAGGGTQVEDGWLLQDANFTFPDTAFPNTTGFLTPSGPYTNITSNSSYLTNGSSSSSYPGTVSPWTTVTTNYSTTTVSCGSYPAPGTYYGILVTNRGSTYNDHSLPSSPSCYFQPAVPTTGGKYNYTEILSYTYTNFPTYSYATFTTNITYTTNVYDFVLNENTSYTYPPGFSGKKVFIKGANVTLALTNGLDGTEGFTWNTGASIVVYSAAPVTVGGTNYLNPTGTASSFLVYCTPSVNSFTLNGNGQFTGVLVAPNAALNLNGGGNANTDFCGSIMCYSATLNGHFSFHYDEALLNQVKNGRYIVSSWDEIDPRYTP